MRILSYFVCLVVFVAAAAPIGAKVVYVHAGNGSDSDSGLTWALAEKSVAVGLSAAASGDEVWVAAGVYLERINLKAGVALYGGFAGTETSRGQRNWQVNKSILDGNQAGIVVTAPAGLEASAIIDGFTIRNGKASSHCCPR